MTQTPTPDQTPSPSPLQLATDARVSCAALEEQLTRGHHRKALETLARLWQRIDAMAGRIEDLTAQLEGHFIGAAEIPILIPDEPAPEFVREEIPAREPLGENPNPPSLPNGRPPGFLEVRRRMRRHGRRTDAIDRIKAAGSESDDSAPRKPWLRATEWRAPQKKPRPWKRFVTAVEQSRLPLDRPISIGEIRRVIEISSAGIDSLQTDLVLEGQPYRIERKGPRSATIVRI